MLHRGIRNPKKKKMPTKCFISGCTNKRDGSKRISFHTIPTVITDQGEKTLELSSRRRREWLASINRDRKPSARSIICSDHFIGGCPVDLYNYNHPDWVPTLRIPIKKNQKPNSRSKKAKDVKKKESRGQMKIRTQDEKQIFDEMEEQCIIKVETNLERDVEPLKQPQVSHEDTAISTEGYGPNVIVVQPEINELGDQTKSLQCDKNPANLKSPLKTMVALKNCRSSFESQDTKTAADFLSRVKGRFTSKNKPNVYMQFLNTLTRYNEGLRKKNECTAADDSMVLTEAEVLSLMSRLFEDDQDLLLEFRTFIQIATAQINEITVNGTQSRKSKKKMTSEICNSCGNKIAIPQNATSKFLYLRDSVTLCDSDTYVSVFGKQPCGVTCKECVYVLMDFQHGRVEKYKKRSSESFGIGNRKKKTKSNVEVDSEFETVDMSPPLDSQLQGLVKEQCNNCEMDVLEILPCGRRRLFTGAKKSTTVCEASLFRSIFGKDPAGITCAQCISISIRKIAERNARKRKLQSMEESGHLKIKRPDKDNQVPALFAWSTTSKSSTRRVQKKSSTKRVEVLEQNVINKVPESLIFSFDDNDHEEAFVESDIDNERAGISLPPEITSIEKIQGTDLPLPQEINSFEKVQITDLPLSPKMTSFEKVQNPDLPLLPEITSIGTIKREDLPFPSEINRIKTMQDGVLPIIGTIKIKSESDSQFQEAFTSQLTKELGISSIVNTPSTFQQPMQGNMHYDLNDASMNDISLAKTDGPHVSNSADVDESDDESSASIDGITFVDTDDHSAEHSENESLIDDARLKCVQSVSPVEKEKYSKSVEMTWNEDRTAIYTSTKTHVEHSPDGKELNNVARRSGKTLKRRSNRIISSDKNHVTLAKGIRFPFLHWMKEQDNAMHRPVSLLRKKELQKGNPSQESHSGNKTPSQTQSSEFHLDNCDLSVSKDASLLIPSIEVESASFEDENVLSRIVGDITNSVMEQIGENKLEFEVVVNKRSSAQDSSKKTEVQKGEEMVINIEPENISMNSTGDPQFTMDHVFKETTVNPFESVDVSLNVAEAINENQLKTRAKCTPLNKELYWLYENYEAADGATLSSGVLFNQYVQYCFSQKLDPVNKASFGKMLRMVFPNVRTRSLGSRKIYYSKMTYCGIRIKPSSMLWNMALPLIIQPQPAALGNMDDSVKDELSRC